MSATGHGRRARVNPGTAAARGAVAHADRVGLRGRLAGAALALLFAWAALFTPAAHAHEMSIAEMEVREVAPGEFLWQWTATGNRPATAILTPAWPAGCTADDMAVRCGRDGLKGEFSIGGIGDGYSAALVKIWWRDGGARVYTLTPSQPSVHLYGGADDRRGAAEVASAYTVLGVQHILEGIDHLAFVLGLLFLVGYGRRLLWTITAFTAAHSLTLACSALDLLTLRSPPVEATIALSIMLVAGEALHTRETFARRWPALVAFLFGLVHGLGFAGALKDVGLPANHLWVALLTFNVGVELGQLLTIALAWLVYRAVRRLPVAATARYAALYVIGGVAAWWSITRVVAIFA